MAKRDGREKRVEFTLFLETTEPNKSGDDSWQATAVATVLYHRRHAPDPPKEVVFSLDGAEIERISTDEEGGQASTVVAFSKPGSYLLTAFVSDLPGVRCSKRISVKAEQKVKKIPASVLVSYTGKCGKQVIMIVAVAEDGSFIPNFTGKMMDGDKFCSFTTGPGGTCEYETSFGEEERNFRVWVGSKPEQTWSDTLLGPKQ